MHSPPMYYKAPGPCNEANLDSANGPTRRACLIRRAEKLRIMPVSAPTGRNIRPAGDPGLHGADTTRANIPWAGCHLKYFHWLARALPALTPNAGVGGGAEG